MPEMAQLVKLIESPAGNVGEAVQLVTGSPPSVGETVVIAVFCVKVYGLPP